jgi:hypothetical protein|tara:strand:- start:22 stop:495 length:474 start_codon:yes stop_codon:yes gene_type:complete
MAVPTSGPLSMKDMAQEALYGTWGSGTITGSIGLYALVNGGNQNSGNTYPAINQACLPNPASRNSSVLADVQGPSPSTATADYYFNQNIGVASDLIVGDELFSDSSLTTTMPAGTYYQDNTVNNDEHYCYVVNPCAETYIQVNSGGVITALECDFCP